MPRLLLIHMVSLIETSSAEFFVLIKKTLHFLDMNESPKYEKYEFKAPEANLYSSQSKSYGTPKYDVKSEAKPTNAKIDEYFRDYYNEQASKHSSISSGYER